MRSTRIISEAPAGEKLPPTLPANPVATSDSPVSTPSPGALSERPVSADFFTTSVYLFVLIALLSQLALLLVFDI